MQENARKQYYYRTKYFRQNRKITEQYQSIKKKNRIDKEIYNI